MYTSDQINKLSDEELKKVIGFMASSEDEMDLNLY